MFFVPQLSMDFGFSPHLNVDLFQSLMFWIAWNWSPILNSVSINWHLANWWSHQNPI